MREPRKRSRLDFRIFRREISHNVWKKQFKAYSFEDNQHALNWCVSFTCRVPVVRSFDLFTSLGGIITLRPDVYSSPKKAMNRSLLVYSLVGRFDIRGNTTVCNERLVTVVFHGRGSFQLTHVIRLERRFTWLKR